MVTLGIETSCDETAAAVLCKRRILSNVVSSSVPLHARYGGVVPEIASRFHIEYINRVTKRALRKARKSFRDVGLIAVTDKPGLPGSLQRALKRTSAAFQKARGTSARSILDSVGPGVSGDVSARLQEHRKPDPGKPLRKFQ